MMTIYQMLSAKDKAFWKIGDVVDFADGLFRHKIIWLNTLNDYFIEGWFKRVMGIGLKKAMLDIERR